MSHSPYPTCYSEYIKQIIPEARLIAAPLSLWGPKLAFTEETIKDELQHAIKLDNKHRGELAELAFMRKAASLGFFVARPWGDSDRYDVVVRSGKIFWRVQIKSVRSKAPGRNYYCARTVSHFKMSYTAEEIDFLAAYIFPEDTWYIFPVAVVEGHKSVCLVPSRKRAKFEPYREAWKLMRPEPEPPDAIVI